MTCQTLKICCAYGAMMSTEASDMDPLLEALFELVLRDP